MRLRDGEEMVGIEEKGQRVMVVGVVGAVLENVI